MAAAASYLPLAYLFAAWLAVNLLRLLATRGSRRFRRLLDNLGIELGVISVYFRFTCFNYPLWKLSKNIYYILHPWFAIGSIVGILLMMSSSCIVWFNLLHCLLQTVHFSWQAAQEHLDPIDPQHPLDLDVEPAPSPQPQSRFILTPMLPGLNLPLSHLPYLMLALLVNGVFHEAGHALAAGLERVRPCASIFSCSGS